VRVLRSPAAIYARSAQFHNSTVQVPAPTLYPPN